MNILIAFLIFSGIVLFHEFGHFIVAKANKIGVVEFSLGMGPRIISYMNTKEGKKVTFFKPSQYFEGKEEYGDHTVYSWKLFPFGGSCMMVGELEEDEAPNAFNNASIGGRIATIFAGPFFNFILGFFLAMILIGSSGYSAALIQGFTENSPMKQAGFQQGDVIQKIDHKKIVVDGELSYYLMFHPLRDKEVTVSASRQGQTITKTITPVKNEEDGKYYLGVTHGGRIKGNIGQTVFYSAYEVKYWIDVTLQSLKQMVTGKISLKEVSGPVGIVKAVDTVMDETKDEGISIQLLSVLNMAILLTANLGVMNLLPIPALDGGRLLLLFLEAIRKKPLPQKIEEGINMGGFCALMLLMVVIMVNDVIKLFH